jgi:hypothetical protein
MSSSRGGTGSGTGRVPASGSAAAGATAEAGVIDVFGTYAHGAGSLGSTSGPTFSSKSAVGVIDSTIRKRAYKLVGEAPLDAFIAVPAENRRSTVATVQVAGRYAYAQLRALPNADAKAMRRQPFAHATFYLDVCNRERFVYRLGFSTAYAAAGTGAWELKLGKIAQVPLPA